MLCPAVGTDGSLPGGQQSLCLPFALSLPRGDSRCAVPMAAARGTLFTDLRPWDEQPREGWQQAWSRARVSAGVPRPVTPDRGLA